MLSSRDAEIKRYEQCYRNPRYKMGRTRHRDVTNVLKKLDKGSLLDVGTGRGEGVEIAKKLGFKPVIGLEPVEYLCGGDVMQGIATDLPFAIESFDTVTCLDVMEHLIEEDLIPALKEMRRVTKRYVLLTASERPSVFLGKGTDLHISKRPVDEWDKMFREVFVGAEFTKYRKLGCSPGWLIEV